MQGGRDSQGRVQAGMGHAVKEGGAEGQPLQRKEARGKKGKAAGGPGRGRALPESS